MGKLLGIALLAILVHQGYQHGWPLIERHLNKSQSVGGAEEDGQAEAIRCVQLARQANRTLSDTLRQFGGKPAAQQAWTAAFIGLSGEIGDAESACFCSADGCAPAAKAVDEMRELSLSFDGMTRGESRGFINPAQSQERIEELLSEAAHLAGTR